MSAVLLHEQHQSAHAWMAESCYLGSFIREPTTIPKRNNNIFIHYSSIACDGRFLYAHSAEGLIKIGMLHYCRFLFFAVVISSLSLFLCSPRLRSNHAAIFPTRTNSIGTGKNSLKGHVYRVNPLYRCEEEGWLVHLNGFLFFRSYKCTHGVCDVLSTDDLTVHAELHLVYPEEGINHDTPVVVSKADDTYAHMFSDGHRLFFARVGRDIDPPPFSSSSAVSSLPDSSPSLSEELAQAAIDNDQEAGKTEKGEEALKKDAPNSEERTSSPFQLHVDIFNPPVLHLAQTKTEATQTQNQAPETETRPKRIFRAALDQRVSLPPGMTQFATTRRFEKSLEERRSPFHYYEGQVIDAKDSINKWCVQ